MLAPVVHVQTLALHLVRWAGAGLARARAQHGQTTAEYALVLVGVAAVALLIVAWAKGTGKISGLLDTVLNGIVKMVT
ncbi:MAG: hypothetical protein ACRDZ9_05805 [Acidimicrobiales bacterium]